LPWRFQFQIAPTEHAMYCAHFRADQKEASASRV
jgi:hypothetical protein